MRKVSSWNARASWNESVCRAPWTHMRVKKETQYLVEIVREHTPAYRRY